MDDQYADMSTEHIYNLLPEPQGFGQLLASADCGGVLDHPDLQNGQATAENISVIESQLTVAINQAAEAAKAQGKLPAGLE